MSTEWEQAHRLAEEGRYKAMQAPLVFIAACGSRFPDFKALFGHFVEVQGQGGPYLACTCPTPGRNLLPIAIGIG